VVGWWRQEVGRKGLIFFEDSELMESSPSAAEPEGFQYNDFDMTPLANFFTGYGLMFACITLVNAASAVIKWGELCVNGLLAREDCVGGLWDQWQPRWAGGDIGGPRNLAILHMSGFAVGCAVMLPAGLLLRRIAHSGGAALLFVRKHRNAIFGALMIFSVLCMQWCRCLADLRRAQGGGSGAVHVRVELKYDSQGLPRRVCVDARPWETALIPKLTLTNEDWGCEGRYNSGLGCLVMTCCFSFLAWMPVSWGCIAATAVAMWLVVLGAALATGMYGEGLARQLLLLALVAVLSLRMASERRKESMHTYLTWQTLLDISQRTRAFLATLLPRGVLVRASMQDNNVMQDRLLELQADVEDVLCLFCCLPPMETLGRSLSLSPPPLSLTPCLRLTAAE
jgi:hypothetical protein